MATRKIRIPKGQRVSVYVKNKTPEGRVFYFRQSSLTVSNDSDDFGQPEIKLVFEKTKYRRKGE